MTIGRVFTSCPSPSSVDLSPLCPQLIKRRGKSGLLLLDAAWSDVAAWLRDHRNREVQIGETRGALTSFIVEPFVAHAAADEYYVAIQVQCKR